MWLARIASWPMKRMFLCGIVRLEGDASCQETPISGTLASILTLDSGRKYPFAELSVTIKRLTKYV
jgi:hypothetical protein